MAISLAESPATYSPVYHPIVFEFSSNNSTECEFSYICDLYINGTFAIRLKEYPVGLPNAGIFQLQAVLKDYLTFDLNRNLTGWADNPNSILKYELQMRESYNTSTDCTGSPTVSSVLLTVSDYYAWNGTVQYGETITATKYVATDVFSKFLTDSPNYIKVGLKEHYTLTFIQDVANTVYRMRIKTYDYSGSLVNTYLYSNTYYATTDTNELMVSVWVGCLNLNLASLVGSPTQPIIDENIQYYSVQLIDSTSAIVSELKYFEVDLKCTKFEKNKFWWLNRKGGFDCFNFKMKTFKSSEISRTTFNKPLSVTYVSGDRGESVMSVSDKINVTCNTDWITESEGKWLESLYTSPEVYLDYHNSYTASVAITGAAHNANGTAYFVLEPGVILPTGTVFTYVVDDGSPIGMANSGTGTIIDYDSGTGFHETDVVSTISAGAIITGSLIANVDDVTLIPVIVTSPVYEEKVKLNVKNVQHSISVRASYKSNIQTL